MIYTLVLPCFLLFLTGDQTQKETHKPNNVTIEGAIGFGFEVVAVAKAWCFSNPVAWWLSHQILAGKPGVTKANIHCLRLGMTMEQVAKILGNPEDAEGNEEGYSCSWTNPTGTIDIVFDPDTFKVVWIHFTPER